MIKLCDKRWLSVFLMLLLSFNIFGAQQQIFTTQFRFQQSPHETESSYEVLVTEMVRVHLNDQVLNWINESHLSVAFSYYEPEALLGILGILVHFEWKMTPKKDDILVKASASIDPIGFFEALMYYYHFDYEVALLGQLMADNRKLMLAILTLKKHPQFEKKNSPILKKLDEKILQLQLNQAIIALIRHFLMQVPDSLETRFIPMPTSHNNPLFAQSTASDFRWLSLIPLAGAHAKESFLYNLYQGRIHLAKGETEQAGQYLRQAIAIRPFNSAALLYYGAYYLYQGNLTRAKHYWTQALGETKGYASLFYQLHRYFLLVDDNISAQLAAESALAIMPNAQLYYWMGTQPTLSSRERLIYLTQATSLAPREAHFYAVSVPLRLKHEGVEKALEEAKIALSLEPQNPLYWAMVGRLMMGTDETSKGMLYYQKALMLLKDDEMLLKDQLKSLGFENSFLPDLTLEEGA